jgi:hypothetical protein
MLSFCKALPVQDPKRFMAEATVEFARYPAAVWHEAVSLIPKLEDPPGMAAVARGLRQVWDGPIGRAFARAARRRELPVPVPRPRTPDEQARIDAQIEEWRRTPFQR